MQRLKTALLPISILWIVFLYACTPKTVKNLQASAPSKPQHTISYFSDAQTDYVYKASVSALGKNFGGIFIAKKTNDSTHRIVLTTEFGNKLLDFELSGDNFKVNFALDELNRKIVINTLKSDFRVLFRSDFPIARQFGTESTTILEARERKERFFIFTDSKTGLSTRLVRTKGSKEKLEILYMPLKNTLAEKIILDHQNINLKVELYLMN